MLPLAAARVAGVGFAHRGSGAQRQPDYDYTRRAGLWDTRYPAGDYTAFGPAEELVRNVDDALAIIGPGEEVHLEFDASLPPPPPGWVRYFVFESNGWAKDMDLYTRDGETVEPVPSSGQPVTIADQLHQLYNVRYQAQR